MIIATVNAMKLISDLMNGKIIFASIYFSAIMLNIC